MTKRRTASITALHLSVGLVALATATPAFSQAAVVQPASSDATSEKTESSSEIKDIVVVAQRRSERLQDVPVSVTALSSEALSVSGVTSTISLQNSVPGLSMSVQQTSISPFIRGIGNRNTSPGDESAAALYVDGVYTASLAASVFALSNIDRIEVVKGPQGTLFGRNAAAGVIQVITKTPSHTPSVEMSGTYANYNTFIGQFYGTVGVTDTLAADLSIYGMNQANGWGRNANTGNEAFKGHEFAIRTKWLLDLGNTKISLSGDYDKNRPVLQPALRALPGQKLIDGSGYLGFYTVNNTIDVSGTNEQWGGNLQIRHDFGGAELLSISSYRDVKVNLPFDQDGSAAPATTAIFKQYARTTTQELQLLSPGHGPVQWIIGAFYFHDASAYDPLTIGGTALGGRVIDRFARQVTTSYSGFAQATFEILPETHLIAGIRYTSDKRRITGVDLVNGVAGTPVDQRATFSKPTWKISLDHKFSEDIMGYAQYSRGFKSGVFSAAAPTTPAVRPEIVDAFELGLKTDLFDRHVRFNASFFYNKFKDVQLQVPILGASVLLNAARGDVKGAEFELQVVPVSNLQLSANISYLDGTYTSFPIAPGFIPLPAGGSTQVVIDASGRDTIYTPPLTANFTIQYKIPTDIGEFDINGSAYYNDGFFFDPENRLRQASYTLLNATLGWTSSDERFGVQLFARNLTNAQYYNQIIPQRFGDTSVPDAPRTYGITMRVKLN